MAKGVDFVIKIEDGGLPGTYNILGGQRGATLNRSSETIDITTKSSSGWRENEASIKEWSIEADGLLVESDTAFSDLESAYMNGTKVLVELATAAGNKYSGEALITDFPIEAPYDDTATYSVTLQGTGALTKTTV
ncbi:phage major tail protein, TP901-1 family [Paramaledivibacter caminithermalis]|jgi:TP901-1 family phage major tail protein|uniref:Phage major tail protein, TP901-1 family n=1 Tax=Paramaledivibacter caminithermalis (strain DSM 15212 / CIP 107654 / DViRD3) TaxID=1121301 RepID=A0A1M6SWC9_PARC5|nr:phage major tail protein, TP901-1 family [Paramaledivibacter caminithermalis]SHK48969.1 phage major tail protein, TP901-1 family [Paramaledivibacter caminithermalis DSM 15212]